MIDTITTTGRKIYQVSTLHENTLLLREEHEGMCGVALLW